MVQVLFMIWMQFVRVEALRWWGESESPELLSGSNQQMTEGDRKGKDGRTIAESGQRRCPEVNEPHRKSGGPASSLTEPRMI